LRASLTVFGAALALGAVAYALWRLYRWIA
jgi:hypothetical protein